jgi:choline-sulfatase
VTRQRYWDLYDDVDVPMPAVTERDVTGDPHSARLRVAVDAPGAQVTDDDVRNARRAYLGNISYVDDWTGRLMTTLDGLGVADDTVVMLVADHGDMLGERGLWYKMNFFEGSSRIPLIVHAPQRFSPRRVTTPVSLVDVLPTIAELAGASLGELPSAVAGQSLIGLCNGSEQPRTVVGEYMAEGSVAPIVMIRSGSLKFVHCPADPDQLYDLATDPHELVNLAADPAHAAQVQQLRSEVAARWDLAGLTELVLADQARRRYVTEALRCGEFTAWEYSPPSDGSVQYMRNHLDLNDVERLARWPR